jgi:hypothetical protein
MGVIIALIVIVAVWILCLTGDDTPAPPFSTADKQKAQAQRSYNSYLAGKVGRTIGKSIAGRERRRWRL